MELIFRKNESATRSLNSNSPLGFEMVVTNCIESFSLVRVTVAPERGLLSVRSSNLPFTDCALTVPLTSIRVTINHLIPLIKKTYGNETMKQHQTFESYNKKCCQSDNGKNQYVKGRAIAAGK